MKKSLFIAGLLACGTLYGQNPIVPPGVYLADPEGHQWKDGKLYLYVSRDESPDYYCSWSYDLLSTSDLKNWKITKNAFASKGPNDQVPYSDGELYASDAAYKNGKYYYITVCGTRSTKAWQYRTRPTDRSKTVSR